MKVGCADLKNANDKERSRQQQPGHSPHRRRRFMPLRRGRAKVVQSLFVLQELPYVFAFITQQGLRYLPALL
ncbi:hypothetical protein [Roseateles albus]|uniref:Uncharacterized protein n=1 Tax=Roseateles albus TaxID=2987525 RepID=A0ABT5KE38_9BURK|nr:hypothetical protein [Roseateles albus]MDC8772190.1 hypothetical protein [Roseateles albus]